MGGCSSFSEADIAPFLALAQAEGWISDRWEFEFLLQAFPQGCLAWREGGHTLGYLTSVKYGKSGWIGNLLVSPEARRHGVGRALMESAILEMLRSGVETIWLTASEQGADLYRRLGFSATDTILRWTGRGSLKPSATPVPHDPVSVQAIDRAGWGESRESLLATTCRRGSLYASSCGFLCCQEWTHGTQLGPWGCLIGKQAGPLLDEAIGPGNRPLFLDVPAGNHAATDLLSQRGFAVKGSNLLMYFGHTPQYQPAKVYALASMGSMG